MLMDLAESVRQTLMIEQKLQFEQELEKQVQGFIVEVIQLRTSFESQGKLDCLDLWTLNFIKTKRSLVMTSLIAGPGISNISPDEAMSRLVKFWKSYNTFDSKQHTLQVLQQISL